MRVADATIGRRVGRLVIDELFRPDGSQAKYLHARCTCDCGKSHTLRVNDLGRSESCGCLNRQIVSHVATRHGLRATRFYRAAANAYKRCNYKSDPGWKRYGGRGIRFLFPSLADFAEYVRTLPGADDNSLTIDRKDNMGHYERGNLRWATRKEQANNTRRNKPKH